MMSGPIQSTVGALLGPYKPTDFKSGLVERCRKYWDIPIVELPNEALATFLRQRIALPLVVPEARRRMEAGYRDDSEMYDGEMANALADVEKTMS